MTAGTPVPRVPGDLVEIRGDQENRLAIGKSSDQQITPVRRLRLVKARLQHLTRRRERPIRGTPALIFAWLRIESLGAGGKSRRVESVRPP